MTDQFITSERCVQALRDRIEELGEQLHIERHAGKMAGKLNVQHRKRIEELEEASLFKSNRIAELVKDYTSLQRKYDALVDAVNHALKNADRLPFTVGLQFEDVKQLRALLGDE